MMKVNKDEKGIFKKIACSLWTLTMLTVKEIKGL